MIHLLTAILLSTTLKTYPVEYISCYDGDTCTFNVILETGTERPGLEVEIITLVKKLGQKTRFCDIDTPEMRGGTDESKAAAVAARDALIGWIKNARTLQIQVPQKNNCEEACDETDKYGRLLVYVIADGVNLNKKLLEGGYAKPYQETCVEP